MRLLAMSALLLVATGARADVLDKLERDCNAGDIAACGHAGGTLVERYPKAKRTPAINVRIFNSWSRACDAKLWAACQRLVSELGDDPDPTAAFAIVDRTCRAGYLMSCLEVAKRLPVEQKLPTEEWLCHQLEKADSTWLLWHWQATMLACTNVSNAVSKDPVRQRQYLILSSMAGQESLEAAWAEGDASAARSAVQIDASRAQAAHDERRRQATLNLIQQGTSMAMGAVQQIGTQYNQARETQRQLETRTHPLNRPPVSSFPRSGGGQAGSNAAQSSSSTAPVGRSGTSQSAAQPGTVPVGQASPQQIAQARQQCMQQPVMETHVTENNQFGAFAQHLEGHMQDAQNCPDTWNPKKGSIDGDHTKYWEPCIGMNARIWNDRYIQQVVDETAARAAKVGANFVTIPGIAGTREACINQGKNPCYYDLHYKIGRLWEAYNRYQGVVDAEAKQRRHVAEEARDAECRRRYP